MNPRTLPFAYAPPKAPPSPFREDSRSTTPIIPSLPLPPSPPLLGGTRPSSPSPSSPPAGDEDGGIPADAGEWSGKCRMGLRTSALRSERFDGWLEGCVEGWLGAVESVPAVVWLPCVCWEGRAGLFPFPFPPPPPPWLLPPSSCDVPPPFRSRRPSWASLSLFNASIMSGGVSASSYSVPTALGSIHPSAIAAAVAGPYALPTTASTLDRSEQRSAYGLCSASSGSGPRTRPWVLRSFPVSPPVGGGVVGSLHRTHRPRSGSNTTG
mmetsp:Transcript_46445/g.140675  ORF Transcript_46445/g.140675 Transcript_46445/m.140675 type:complete len:267 (-) Transcript_46445:197-997(-)